MSAIFDTLKFVKTLKQAGVPENQAEAISVAVGDSHQAANLATKQDVTLLEERVDTKLELLRKDIDNRFTEVRKDIQMLEQRIVSKLGTLIIAVAGGMEILQHFL